MGQAPIPQGVTAICAHEGSAWTAGAFSEPDTLLQWTPAGKVAGRTEVASEGIPLNSELHIFCMVIALLPVWQSGMRSHEQQTTPIP